MAAHVGGGHHFRQQGAQIGIGGFQGDFPGLERRGRGGKLTALRLPELAAVIKQFHVLHAVDIQNPGATGGKPVVGIAIKNDRAVLIDACTVQQALELFLAGDITAHRIDQVGVPDKIGGPWNMAHAQTRRGSR